MYAAAAIDAIVDEDADRLLELVNEYRLSAPVCQGRRLPASGPLAPDARLAKVNLDAKPLTDALKKTGYAAAYAQVITLQGPQTPESAMIQLRDRYCSAVLNPALSDAAVVHADSTWSVVLAQPLLSPDLGDWRAAGKKTLELVNAARRQPRNCGKRHFDAARRVEWNEQLAAAALAHSRNMAQHGYFEHRGQDGSGVGDRADREGYRWRHIGENIATGQGSAHQVVAGWLASPPHCANIMNPLFTEMGAAYATSANSKAGIYWTQVFGAGR
jgi:uncharacterized protein YkwD